MRDDENFFQFGDVKSSDYKVYCSGGGTYSAPARDVELFHVLGRDGDLVVDHGSYQNIDVRYPCWVARNAPQYVNAFRQVLCALRGYQKIIDPYNPDEYRMGIYQAAFEPNMMNARNDSAEFDVVFNCKPQRFLTEGDDAIRITSGQNVANPTMYDAHPMLEAYGYGDIVVGGKTVTIENVPLGPTFLLNEDLNVGYTELNSALYNTGDAITIGPSMARTSFRFNPSLSSGDTIAQVSLTDTGGTGVTLNTYHRTSSGVVCDVNLPQMSAVAGTSKTTTHTFTITVTYLHSGVTYQATANVTVTVSYSHTSVRDALSAHATSTTSGTLPQLVMNGYSVGSGVVSVDSSVSANGAPTYIDLDIGEAWIVENDEMISVNKSVYIPDILPVLKGNQNTVVSFDNTITRLDIIPRWYTI